MCYKWVFNFSFAYICSPQPQPWNKHLHVTEPPCIVLCDLRRAVSCAFTASVLLPNDISAYLLSHSLLDGAAWLSPVKVNSSPQAQKPRQANTNKIQANYIREKEAPQSHFVIGFSIPRLRRMTLASPRNNFGTLQKWCRPWALYPHTLLAWLKHCWGLASTSWEGEKCPGNAPVLLACVIHCVLWQTAIVRHLACYFPVKYSLLKVSRIWMWNQHLVQCNGDML